MNENQNEPRQELNENDLDEVHGGLIAYRQTTLMCYKCGWGIRLQSGDRFPKQCPGCGEESITMI